MGNRRSFNPAGVHKPVGPYVHVVTCEPKELVFISGCIALDAEGRIVGEGDVVRQTEQALRNMEVMLQAAGGSFGNVVKLNTFMLDVKDYPLVAKVRSRYLVEPFPATTLLEVTGLVFPELLIEIEAIASI